MKNIQGNQKNLILRDKKGRIVYKFKAYGNDKFTEETYDKHGNVLTVKYSKGSKVKYTRDEHGKTLTFKDSKGLILNFFTRYNKVNVLNTENSKGVIRDYTNI